MKRNGYSKMPWFLDPADPRLIRNAEGGTVAAINTESDAVRIVLSVGACEGVPNRALTRRKLRKLDAKFATQDSYRRATQLAVRYMSQRDELLAVCDALLTETQLDKPIAVLGNRTARQVMLEVTR